MKIAIDYETTGLGHQDRAFAVSIATEKDVHYMDTRINSCQEIKSFIESFVSKSDTIVAQNLKFDARMGEKTFGINLMDKSTEDIEVLSRIIRNDYLSYSLDNQAKRSGIGLKSDEVKKYMKANKLKDNEFYKVPIEVMRPYAEQDSRITFDLHTKYLEDIRKQPGSCLKVWENEKKLTKVCYGMEKNGLLLNMEYTKKAKEKEECLIREAKANFRVITGQEYNGSRSQLVEVFEKNGHVIPTTEKNNPMLTDDVLEKFNSPVAQAVRSIRFHEKRLVTYYESFLSLVTPFGFIHPDMRQAGTATGRFSYREPNLQNMPADEHDQSEYVVRGCFRPRPGYVFVAIDYNQQEYRLMVAYSKKRNLIHQVMAGTDVHQATADMVGIPRSYAKTLNFAILYGAGNDKISKMLGISLEEAFDLRKKYFDSLVEVDNLIFKIKKYGQAKGYVTNWFGRNLWINDARFAYKLPNHLIQSGGADICKIAMVGCDEYIKNYDIKLVLQVHDALYFEMREDEMSTHIPKIQEIMVDSFPGLNGMYMDTDVKWSKISLADRHLQKWQM